MPLPRKKEKNRHLMQLADSTKISSLMSLFCLFAVVV